MFGREQGGNAEQRSRNQVKQAQIGFQTKGNGNHYRAINRKSYIFLETGKAGHIENRLLESKATDTGTDERIMEDEWRQGKEAS